MGCDIHSRAYIRKDNSWQRINEPIFCYYEDKKCNEPFIFRNYGLFAFLANVRNYGAIEPLSKPRGIPDFIHKIEADKYDEVFLFGDHSFSHYYLNELLDVDYDKIIENRRYSETIGNFTNGAATCEKGKGEFLSLQDYLGESYFKDLETLKTLGKPEDVLIVFGFDS